MVGEGFKILDFHLKRVCIITGGTYLDSIFEIMTAARLPLQNSWLVQRNLVARKQVLLGKADTAQEGVDLGDGGQGHACGGFELLTQEPDQHRAGRRGEDQRRAVLEVDTLARTGSFLEAQIDPRIQCVA